MTEVRALQRAAGCVVAAADAAAVDVGSDVAGSPPTQAKDFEVVIDPIAQNLLGLQLKVFLLQCFGSGCEKRP